MGTNHRPPGAEPQWDKTPVPKSVLAERARVAAFHEELRIKKELEKWRIFLERLTANGGIITLTLKQCGISSNALRRRRALHPGFEELYNGALEAGIDKLEDVAKARAMFGTPQPIFYKGRRVDSVNEVSDDLLKFVLRGHRPEKYGHKLDISGKIDLTGIELSNLSMADLEVIAAGKATKEFLDRIRTQQPAIARAESSPPGSEAHPSPPAAGLPLPAGAEPFDPNRAEGGG